MTTESVLQCVRVCLPLYSDFYQFSTPIPSSFIGNPPVIFLELHYAGKFGAKDKQLSFKPHFLRCNALYSLRLLAERERERERPGPHFQTSRLFLKKKKKSANISQFRLGVRCAHVAVAPFILNMWAWENNKFKHPEDTFPYILWLPFSLYSYHSKTKTKLDHTNEWKGNGSPCTTYPSPANWRCGR